MLSQDQYDLLFKSYSEIRAYDIHYSTIRSGISTFLITFGLGVDAYTLKTVIEHTPGSNSISPCFIGVGLLFAAFVFLLTTILSATFQRWTFACWRLQERLDKVFSGKLQFDYSYLGFRDGFKTIGQITQKDKISDNNKWKDFIKMGFDGERDIPMKLTSPFIDTPQKALWSLLILQLLVSLLFLYFC